MPLHCKKRGPECVKHAVSSTPTLPDPSHTSGLSAHTTLHTLLQHHVLQLMSKMITTHYTRLCARHTGECALQELQVLLKNVFTHFAPAGWNSSQYQTYRHRRSPQAQVAHYNVTACGAQGYCASSKEKFGCLDHMDACFGADVTHDRHPSSQATC